ncbi:MAG: dTDP-4-dehydrorhamnose reductase [Phycisphaerae bacterium]|nr:dTDP-4-dehydrorhamnose reductase [Phycisphaerae bacterium]
MSNTTILITGADGMLGRELTWQLRQFNYEILAADVENCDFILDITDKRAVLDFITEHKPSIVFNCAAWTDVDGAENFEAAAKAVNGDGPGYLAGACKVIDALFVHVSTDYVFDGTGQAPYKPDDPVNPKTAYGRSKLLGEQQIQSVGGHWLIVRTSWLVGGNGKNFVDTIADVARGRDSIKVVNDQIGCPTFVPQLATCLINLAQKNCQGIYHFCNSPACSWFDLAKLTVNLAKIDCRVAPCATAEFPRPAPRPAYSVLDCTKTLEKLDWQPTTWPDALRMYLDK